MEGAEQYNDVDSCEIKEEEEEEDVEICEIEEEEEEEEEDDVEICEIEEEQESKEEGEEEEEDQVVEEVTEQDETIHWQSQITWKEELMLAFQHYFLTLSVTRTIMDPFVEEMGGGNVERAETIQTVMFVNGFNTLLQCVFGTRLPVIMGPSGTFTLVALSIISEGRYAAISDPQERFHATMKGLQGALIIGSISAMILGFSGTWKKITRLLSSLAAIPLLTLVGLRFYRSSVPQVAKCGAVGIPVLVLTLCLPQVLPRIMNVKSSLLVRYVVVFSIAILWPYAYILTISGAYKNSPIEIQEACGYDSNLLYAAPWIMVPRPFKWGKPTFQFGDASALMVVCFVSLIESTGTFMGASKYVDAPPLPSYALSRGIGWQGVGLLLDGVFGTIIGSAASGENVGLLGLTLVKSQRIIPMAAGMMITFSLFGKIGAIFAAIPVSAAAAFCCILHGYEACAGLGSLENTNLKRLRTKIILGTSLFMGLGVPFYVNYYHNKNGHYPFLSRNTKMNTMLNAVFLSESTIAVMLVIFMEGLNYGNRKVRREIVFPSLEDCDITPRREFYSINYNFRKTIHEFGARLRNLL